MRKLRLVLSLVLAFCFIFAVTAAEPRFEFRELYAPGHFGNSYEVMGENEARDVLAEAVFWGCNRYADWFDTLDCSDLFAPKRFPLLGDALWDAKKANFASAQHLGMSCALVLTPNHVYVDQCLPGLKTEEGGRIFGQLICPSKPEARAIILKNHENLFADLARAGVRLSALCPCPYDFGGCGCEKCKPWILTWAELVREIHKSAAKYHPGVEMHMIGWWWTAEEHKMFAVWADREAPGWVKTIYLHIPYGKTRVGDVIALPRGCARGAFVHISYPDKSVPGDKYGMLGPMIAPKRLQKTLDDLHAQGVTRLMAYSEGDCDDVNRALFGGLSSGKYGSSEEVLRAYAKRYFGVDDAAAKDWATWLAEWGDPFAVDVDRSRQKLDELLAKTPNKDDWRVRQWELKLELFRLHGEIAKGKEWTPERLELVDRFWAVREGIQRGIWGLGLQRTSFHRSYCALPWYQSWAKHVSGEAKVSGKAQ